MQSRPAMRDSICRLLPFVGLLGWLMFPGFADEPALPIKRVGFDRWIVERQRLLDDPSVIAFYDLQEGAGTVLKNKSKVGAALDGTIHDASWEQGRWPGKKAIRFNGKSSLVEIATHELLCPLDRKRGGGGELTIEVWMLAKVCGNGGILDKSSNGTAANSPYAIWMSGSRLVAYMGRQSGGKVLVTADDDVMDKDQWIHMAITIDDQRMSIYRNGVRAGFVKRDAVEISDNGQPLLIGAIGKGYWPFNGLMDEVVIHKRALTDVEIERRAAFVPDVIEPAGPPSITLLSPRGGESLSGGSWHRIQWTSQKVSPRDLVRIEWSGDDGQAWTEIAPSAPNTGEFVWQASTTPSAQCRVRVSASPSKLAAQSDRPFSIVSAEDVPKYEWVKVTLAAPFAPRDGLGVLDFKGRMWLLGGWNPIDKQHFPRICNNEVWSSQDGAAWILEKQNTFKDSQFDARMDWEGRHTAGYVVHRDKMWIVGGDSNQGHHQPDVWNSDNGKNWKLINPAAPWGQRALHHTVAHADKIWVMGGQTMPNHVQSNEAFYRDIWTTTDGAEWTQVTPREPYWSARGMIGGSAVFQDRMWILGGGTYDTPETPRRKFFNDVWSSSDGINWIRHLEKAPWEPRQYHEVAVFDGRLWVLEGYGPEKKPANRNDVWHSADGVNWHPLPNTPWHPRHAAGIVVYDNALWMIAGNNMAPDVWKLLRK